MTRLVVLLTLGIVALSVWLYNDNVRLWWLPLTNLQTPLLTGIAVEALRRQRDEDTNP